MNSSVATKYRALVLDRIAKGHPHVLRKAVPKKKSPTNRGIPAITERIPSCSTKHLLSKAILRATGASEADLAEELGLMRDEGLIHCTNKLWWARGKK